jgi:hypothetical protein
VLLALAFALVFAFAGPVLPARPIVVRVAIALVGSAWQLGALLARGIVAIPSTSGTRPATDGRVLARPCLVDVAGPSLG